ncbi:MAG: type VI secretion system protein TssA [Desulfobacteraceae bacterium]|nr:MAG: type VI secretion system protein TssA [Desulfobacteraceae bacterium]
MEMHCLAKDPIQPNQPAGSDVRYEPEYEQLQAEIDKLAVPSASGGIDWGKVSDLAAAILAKKSKDLLVASYLAVGQVHMRQIEGLVDGLVLIHDLIANYWDSMFPPKKRMRGRLGAIEWWIEKTETALSGVKPQTVAAETLDTVQTTLLQIDALLKGHLPEPPLLRPIQRALEGIPSVSEKETEAQHSPVTEQARSVPTPVPEFEIERDSPKAIYEIAEPETLATEQDAQKVITSCMQKVRKAATFLLENDPTNAMAYRHRRIAAWSLVSGLPPESNGQTQIQPPAPQIRQSLLEFGDEGNWNAVILSAEPRLSQFIFWFDLNRFVAEALNNLGDGYQKAHDAVREETAFFIHRSPGLVDLRFSDGTPFADSETRQWLKDIAMTAGSVMDVAVPTPKTDQSADDNDRMANTLAEAQTLAKKKKLLDAVQLLQTELKNCVSQQETLMWRMALCRMLTGSKRIDMALPHLDLILNDIETYRLESWDPPLALDGLKLVWTAYTSHSGSEAQRKAEAALSQIAKLDPAEALKLTKP